MRKNNFLVSKANAILCFFLTVSGIAGFTGISLFTGCKFFVPQIAEQDELVLIMPQWPPVEIKANGAGCGCGGNGGGENPSYREHQSLPAAEPSLPAAEPSSEYSSYPLLSRWLVEIVGAEESYSFFANDSEFTISVKKNVPVAILVTPITLNSSNEEINFFKPAGTIYPYDFENGIQTLTWAGGFSAFIFKNLVLSKKETGITSEHMNSFLQGFNWKKFEQTVYENEFKVVEGYNPWLLDFSTMQENLSYGFFKSDFLTQKNVAGVQTSSLMKQCGECLLSSYVPENKYIMANGKILVKKGEIALFNYKTDFAVIILYSSAKNVSLEYGFMPIFKKEI